MKYQVPILSTESIKLKKGLLDDYINVYEYDFSKLTNIWGDIQFVKNSSNEIENLFIEIENKKIFIVG